MSLTPLTKRIITALGKKVDTLGGLVNYLGEPKDRVKYSIYHLQKTSKIQVKSKKNDIIVYQNKEAQAIVLVDKIVEGYIPGITELHLETLLFCLEVRPNEKLKAYINTILENGDLKKINNSRV